MGAEHSSVREVRPHAQVAPVQLRALERLDGGGGGLGVAVLDDGRARGPLVLAAREELDGRDLAHGGAVRAELGLRRVEAQVHDEDLGRVHDLVRVVALGLRRRGRLGHAPLVRADADLAAVEVEAVALLDGVLDLGGAGELHEAPALRAARARHLHLGLDDLAVAAEQLAQRVARRLPREITDVAHALVAGHALPAAAALARVEAQGLHGLVERVAQLHDGPARNEDGVRLRVAALLDLEVLANVVLFDVHENLLAARREARREDFFVVHGRPVGSDFSCTVAWVATARGVLASPNGCSLWLLFLLSAARRPVEKRRART
ncbi:unnamed protein product [Pelagomonas calceolata]|uniref:Uncharacterized protein n=1 Tax=Pelagomonas calceolata TaxID=35677 RepID=A0A8J2S5E9_9STRA|nr:unnamed protein product [Pelagomonas calceolata]